MIIVIIPAPSVAASYLATITFYKLGMYVLFTLVVDRRFSRQIQDFDTALADNYRVRLMELGFHPGEVVTCLQTPAFGSPKVFRVANSIFSLDDEVASHILITPVGLA